MSWFSNNYEKAALGGAVVIALGLGYLGYAKVSNVENDFAEVVSDATANDPSVKDADKVTKAKASLDMPRAIERGIATGDRPVDLFTGVPLYISRSAPTGKPVDPNSAGSEPIHPPIPNKWWLKYNLDPGFADSPQRDADGDGFSNLDEFQGNTDPTDAKKFPSLIGKLKFAKEETAVWALRPGFDSEGAYPFAVTDGRAQPLNKTPAEVMVKPGEIFFATEPMKSRFKFLNAEDRKVMNERLKEEMTLRIVRVEDQKPNKAKKVYEIQAQFPDRERAKYTQYDRTAVLRLDALGLGGSDFKVEENTDFALPPDAPKKDYHLKAITPENIEVEYTDPDGTKKSIVIPKG